MELRLAITTIGDILLKNRITRCYPAEKDVNKDVSLRIPNYQRPYKWTVKNVYQLLEDIEEARVQNKEVYRLGTLILYSHMEKDLTIHDIVDGQQRIISFCLLLKVLALTCGAKNDSEITFLNQEFEATDETISNIKKNYQALERKINNLPEKESIKKIFDYIKDQCELIVIITEDQSEAFQFFDSQNSRGKKLYPHDLLKAYHLREMRSIDVSETEKIVMSWENIDQGKLSSLFCDYLYRLKEWIKGRRADELNEHNIDMFKGIKESDNYTYALFYKGTYAFAEMINNSSIPFVFGMQRFKPFQIETPIISGKPFFEYTQHYYNILKDVKNNDKFEGYYINDNDIVKTLDLSTNKYGVGNSIARLLFDTAILFYIDRFCPEVPSKKDLEMLDHIIVYAFIWAYSLRAQRPSLGWSSAQKYIVDKLCDNSLNIYKVISDADSPVALQAELANSLKPISVKFRENSHVDIKRLIVEKDKNGVFKSYLHYFDKYNFLIQNS